MSAIELVGPDRAPAWLERIAILGHGTEQPFDPPLVEAVADLSARLLKDDFCREQPQLRALGYWLRRAEVERLRQRAERECVGVRAARGLALHLPPANVDTLFAYSWVVSFLLGNANVTRLPSAASPVCDWLVEAIVEALDFRDQAARHVFCRYDHSSGLTARLSALSDLRLIWGGDEKVRQVSILPTRPDGLTLAFPDRKSLCIVCADAYARCDPAARQLLAEQFYNDLFWFDQLGCGSPRALVWIGEVSNQPKMFIAHLLDVVARRQPELEPGTDLSKFVLANELVAAGSSDSAERYGAALTVVQRDASPDVFDTVHGGGFLQQVSVPDVSALLEMQRRDWQTLTVFGFDEQERRALARRLGGRGGYRIVPIGQALSFDTVWDGIDLIEHGSRRIAIS